MTSYTRRRLLTTSIGAATAASLAGCTGSDTEQSTAGAEADEASAVDATAPFHVFGDITEAVVGDSEAVETLVPLGSHGHGWEPSGDTQATVIDSDVFVYMDGFQPWADDMVASMRDDDAPVTAVNIADGIEKLGGHDGHSEEDHSGEEHSEEEHSEEHSEEEHSEEEHSEEHSEEEHSEEEHSEEHSEEEHSEEEHSEESDHGDEHSDEEHSEEHSEEEHGAETHDGGHGHDHGAEDPHVWLDPVRLKQAVTNVRSELVDIDSDNADTYATNADNYRAQLDQLDQSFEDTLGDADSDVVFVAGHNAFQYLESRYGFRVETLTNISPDDRPTPKDIAQAQSLIEEHDLQYVLADPLEDQTAADQLVEETDATEKLPLTAVAGQTQDWADRGWGYIDVMENVNLATLQQALDA
ncbi:metal ABC transporter substrate-binding protein [Halonotius pteroides]|uniref:Zinc ABC transporter substrate-binding protein n=1 Tax=Halonotius pteroides TaxID=268735 RepID=A0A3A6QCR4_9EURY|nr:zinc ABC transporter substrate-binding protein [Halonotius pteroides]RJX48917.1 zinc ABC transporter substrate-binding protein [Halonotius pteroides]